MGSALQLQAHWTLWVDATLVSSTAALTAFLHMVARLPMLTSGVTLTRWNKPSHVIRLGDSLTSLSATQDNSASAATAGRIKKESIDEAEAAQAAPATLPQGVPEDVEMPATAAEPASALPRGTAGAALVEAAPAASVEAARCAC